MQPSSLREGFERIVAEAHEITAEVDAALDSYERQLDAPAPARLLEMGVLLASVRHGRQRARQLASLLPSPNRMPEHLQESVAVIGQALFAFVDSCTERETIIRGMATSLCRRLAA